jgi:hypothetical protein
MTNLLPTSLIRLMGVKWPDRPVVQRRSSGSSKPEPPLRDMPPDVVLPRHNIVVFVHGCFWHRHRCAAGRCVPKRRRGTGFQG